MTRQDRTLFRTAPCARRVASRRETEQGPTVVGAQPSSLRRRAARVSCAALALTLAGVAGGLASPSASHADDLPAPRIGDGAAYVISQFQIVYIDANPAFPAPEDMAMIEVEVGRSSDGFVAPVRVQQPARGSLVCGACHDW